jgi:hypothetical protein
LRLVILDLNDQHVMKKRPAAGVFLRSDLARKFHEVKADGNIMFRGIRRAFDAFFGPGIRRDSLSCSGSGRAGLCICADPPQTIASAMLFRPISPTVSPITP